MQWWLFATSLKLHGWRVIAYSICDIGLFASVLLCSAMLAAYFGVEISLVDNLLQSIGYPDDRLSLAIAAGFMALVSVITKLILNLLEARRTADQEIWFARGLRSVARTSQNVDLSEAPRATNHYGRFSAAAMKAAGAAAVLCVVLPAFSLVLSLSAIIMVYGSLLIVAGLSLAAATPLSHRLELAAVELLKSARAVSAWKVDPTAGDHDVSIYRSTYTARIFLTSIYGSSTLLATLAFCAVILVSQLVFGGVALGEMLVAFVCVQLCVALLGKCFSNLVKAAAFIPAIEVYKNELEILSKPTELSPQAAASLMTIDQTRPGFGSDQLVDHDIDHAMAYGLYASAGARLRQPTLTRTSAAWLKGNVRRGGWGLGFSWDAFSDGEPNPPDTVYGITVAVCVMGLLDAYDFLGDQKCLETACSALNNYKTHFTPTEFGGFFHYSDQAADAIDVPNVNSMLAGQYARVGRLCRIDEMAGLAEKAANHIWKTRIEGPQGVFWTYTPAKKRPNDLVHASYTAFGLCEAARYGSFSGDVRQVVEHLKSFIRDDEIREYPDLRKQNMKARSWGVGMLMATLANANDRSGTENVVKFAGVHDNLTPRQKAHVFFGLASANALIK